MCELTIRYCSRPECAMGQMLLIECSLASSVRSSFFDLPNGIGSSVFVPLEQFHDSSHVQLAQTLADGFAKDISDRSDGGRVLLSSRGCTDMPVRRITRTYGTISGALSAKTGEFVGYESAL